jgi:diguanylate cyclase (GGDEF)-like protein
MDIRHAATLFGNAFLEPTLSDEHFTKIALQLFRKLPDGLIIIGLERNLLYANETAFHLFHAKNDLLLLSEFVSWMKNRKSGGNLDNWVQSYYYNESVKLYEVTCRPIYDIAFENLEDKGTAYFIHDLTPTHGKTAGHEYLISHDPLTGLLNREAFFLEARKRLDENPFEEYTFVSFNVLNFKSFSNKDGNDILKKFGWLLQNKIRREDVSGRLYADRFITLMQTKNYTPELLQSLRAAMYEYGMHTGHKIQYETRALRVLDHKDAVDKMCEAAFQKEIDLHKKRK